jgi:mannosyltransferase OCH1-like enzyme
LLNKYPDYEYILWNEERIEDEKNNFKLYVLYDTCSTYAGISDLIRYDILYNYGGIYIDADTIYTHNNLNFNNLLNNDKEMMIAKSHHNNTFANGFIICKKNSKIMSDVINYFKYNYVPYMPTCMSTGPNIINIVISNYINDVFAINTNQIYPVDWHNKKFIMNDDYIESIRNKYTNSFFYQIGFSTNNIQMEIDTNKKIIYKKFDERNILYPFKKIDEYIITIHQKKKLDQQINETMVSIKTINFKQTGICIQVY